MKEQPEFQEIFTSAAECGHAMLRRICKSLSYMSEGNANLFLWVAIQGLNRRKLESLGSKTVQGEKCVDVKGDMLLCPLRRLFKYSFIISMACAKFW